MHTPSPEDMRLGGLIVLRETGPLGIAWGSGEIARDEGRQDTHARAYVSGRDGTRVDLRRVLACRRREAQLNLLRAIPHPAREGKITVVAM